MPLDRFVGNCAHASRANKAFFEAFYDGPQPNLHVYRNTEETDEETTGSDSTVDVGGDKCI